MGKAGFESVLVLGLVAVRECVGCFALLSEVSTDYHLLIISPF